MRLSKVIRILVTVSMGAVLWIGYGAETAGKAASTAPPLQQNSAAANQPAKGDPVKGEQVYYWRCRPCHSVTAKYGPLLNDLYKRPRLGSGQPVNDETVTDKIMNAGGTNMPAYRYALSREDLANLLTYIRDGHCCTSQDNPPKNPRYRDP